MVVLSRLLAKTIGLNNHFYSKAVYSTMSQLFSTRFYLLVFVLTMLVTSAQAQNITQLIKFLQSKPSLAFIKQQVEQLQQDSVNYIEVTKAVERVLPSGIHQLHYILFTPQYESYHLSVLSEAKQVIGCKLFRVIKNSKYSQASQTFETLHTWLNTHVWKHHFDKHFKQYGMRLTVNDSTFLPFRLYKYGYDCGRNTPFLYTKMKQLVRQRDAYTLQKWLRSMNVELQAYAVEGLARLRHPAKIKRLQKMELPQYKVKHVLSKKFLWRVTDTEVMQQLKHKKTWVYHCVGCFGMDYLPIVTLMSKMGFD